MKIEKRISLLEAVADISYIAGVKSFCTKDSRAKTEMFIIWAKEFELIHKDVIWGVNFLPEYIDSIYYFTIFKIKQWGDV